MQLYTYNSCTLLPTECHVEWLGRFQSTSGELLIELMVWKSESTITEQTVSVSYRSVPSWVNDWRNNRQPTEENWRKSGWIWHTSTPGNTVHSDTCCILTARGLIYKNVLISILEPRLTIISDCVLTFDSDTAHKKTLLTQVLRSPFVSCTPVMYKSQINLKLTAPASALTRAY